MTRYRFCDEMSNEELERFLDGLKELIDDMKTQLDPQIYEKYKIYIEINSKLKIAKEREKYLKTEDPDLKGDYFLGYVDWYFRGSKEEIENIETTIKKLENELKILEFPLKQLRKYEDFAHLDHTYIYGKNLLEKRLNNKR